MILNILQFIVVVLILVGILYIIFKHKTLFAATTNKRTMKKITIKLSKEELPLSQQTTLRQLLGKSSSQELKEALEKIVKVAFLEYCDMILGTGTPSKIESLQQYRLLLLILHYYDGIFPTENEVEKLFHLGTGKSKTLLSQTISVHQNKLPSINKSLLHYLNTAKQNTENKYYELSCTLGIIQKMNNIIKENLSDLEKIRLKPSTSGIYHCPDDTYNRLKTFLNG